jgi:hypothetical protein
MKKVIYSLAIASIFTFPSFSSFAEKTCITNGVVTNLYIGWIEGRQAGLPDDGNSIMIDYREGSKTGTIPVNYRYNLNDNGKGAAFFSMLQTALLTGQKITVKDHYSSNCDDFDEIIMHK